jgi:hypothetical protein
MTRIIEWGPACWIFFHTVVEKIKPEDFLNIRNGLMNHLRMICSNLPCPSCSNHAKLYFQRQRSLNFQTKEEMIGFWWHFHNHVNKMKKKPEFPFSDLSYSNNNLRNVYENFSRQYTAKDTGLKMMSETFHRKNILMGFHKWMVQNNKSFIV